MVEGARYAGAFIGAGVLHLLGFVILAGMDSPKPPQSAHAGRDMSVFFGLPGFRLGLVAAGLGYAVMSFLMTATPLQIVNVSQLGVEENARVIQWHVIAMFAPSFFTGHLIARFGIRGVMTAGLVMYGLCIFMALSGTHSGIILRRCCCWGWAGIFVCLR